MSKNLAAFLKLSLPRSANRYAVLVDGKLIGTGMDIEALLQKARKKYPTKTPAIAKIPGSQTLVLALHADH